MIAKEDLEELYIHQNKSQVELSVIFNCSVRTIRKYLGVYGIAKKIKLSDRFLEIEKELFSINPNAKLIDIKSGPKPLFIQCSCGKEFDRALSVIRKYQTCLCYDCTGWKGASNGYSDSEVREYITSTGCELLSCYENINKKMSLRCHCGRKFTQSYENFRKGNHQGCSSCFHEKEHERQRHSVEHVQRMIQEAGCKWVSGEYKNLKSQLGISCFSCEEEYSISLDKFVYQHKIRCNKCTTNRSTYELYVEHLLMEMGVDFLMDKNLPGALGVNGGQLRFDFIILKDGKPSKVIEVDGMQHYRIGGNKCYFNEKQGFEQRMENDRLKELFTVEKSIPMLRLSYKLFRSTKKKKVLLETLESFIQEETSPSIQMVS